MPDLRPNPAHRIKKLVARARARGVGEIANLGLVRIKETMGSEDGLIFFVRPAGDGPDPVPALPGLELEQASEATGHAYARDIGTESSTTFAARLSGSTACFVVRDDHGHIVHATWVTTAAAWTREVHGYFVPPRDDAYVYESFTRSEARGRGVYPFALRGICAQLGALGIPRVWVAVEADNPSSLRAVAKAGFAEAFRIDYARRWGRLDVGQPYGEGSDLCVDCLTKAPPPQRDAAGVFKGAEQ
jgi:hypothetical protein